LIVTQMMDFPFVFLPGAAFSAAFGDDSNHSVRPRRDLRILGQKPAAHLREL